MKPGGAYTDLHRALSTTCSDNSAVNFFNRGIGRIIDEEVTISIAAGTHTINVFKVTGTIWLFEQWAELTEITTLTNFTNMYSTLYDGTNTRIVTADGATLSGLPVGTVFTKAQDETQPYTVVDASGCQITVPLDAKKVGYPFTLTQKSGTDTYLQLHMTTTDDPVSFKMRLLFTWAPLNGGNFELLI